MGGKSRLFVRLQVMLHSKLNKLSCLSESCNYLKVAYLYKLSQGLDECLVCVMWTVIGHSPGHQFLTSVVIGRWQISGIALSHRITLFLGNFAGSITIPNKP